MFGNGLIQVTLGETRWRMLCCGLEHEVFGYHNLRNAARSDIKNFDTLLDLGLVAPAPEGSPDPKPTGWRVKHGDPLGAFVLTEKGRLACKKGITQSVPADAARPSLTVPRYVDPRRAPPKKKKTQAKRPAAKPRAKV